MLPAEGSRIDVVVLWIVFILKPGEAPFKGIYYVF
jgi:hypothetical protein